MTRIFHFICMQVLLLFGFLPALTGCAEESSGSVETDDYDILNDDGEYEAADMDVEADPKAAAVTKTYYVYNPSGGGCSKALKLTATGTGLTKIVPYGCVVNGTAATAHPSWTTLTSAGTTSLSDTWYARTGDKFDAGASSANYYEWCGSGDIVTVKVTGTTVTKLTYWFTDSSSCVF